MGSWAAPVAVDEALSEFEDLIIRCFSIWTNPSVCGILASGIRTDKWQEDIRLANTKSAIKNIRKSERRRQHNKVYRSRARTLIRRTRHLIEQGELEEAQETALLASKALDKAAKVRVVHPNNASRRKSRLMKQLNKALAEAQPSE
jgi:small subunit ribosomal protein S20